MPRTAGNTGTALGEETDMRGRDPRKQPSPAGEADSGELGELVLADLFASLTEVTERLIGQIAENRVLDAYLLAAGAAQIVEDHVQRDPLGLCRAAAYLGDHGLPRTVGALVTGVANGVEGLCWLSGRHRRTVRWALLMAALRDDLAQLVVDDNGAAVSAHERAVARRLRDQLPTLSPRARCAVLRLPSCFRSFDQSPQDMVELAARFAQRHPGRDAPVLVLGVRTSGGYLAPLVRAALLAGGFATVTTGSARPSRRLRPEVRRAARSAELGGGRIAVVDDPPSGGNAVRSVAESLTGNGVARSAITLLLPLFDDEVPDALADYDAVLLRFKEWSIHQRLAADAVRQALAGLTGQPVAAVLPGSARSNGHGRDHLRAGYEVVLADAARRSIVAVGAGLGYFGRHTIAVRAALPDHLPRTYGFADGIVFRDWLPEADRVTEAVRSDVPAFAAYLAARSSALPAVADRSVGFVGRQPVWEAASRVLERGYGRLGTFLRPVFLDAVVRSLCHVDQPSIIDGATELGHWFRDHGGLRKVESDVRAFASTDLACYDPAYDLAGIDPGGADPEFVAALREAMPCDDERFLLYELVHLWNRARHGADPARASARAVRRYVAQLIPRDIRPPADGPLCALDVDGVLESDGLGFPIITPTAAIVLSALITHGQRPVLVTGRSLPEVRERCAMYGLAGGVAEYGASVYDQRSGTDRNLVSDDERAAVAAVRAAADGCPDLLVDDDYQAIVRAYVRGPDGRRKGLPAATERQLLDRIAPHDRLVRAIRGEHQTDFVPSGVDKGRGLRELAVLLGVSSRPDGIAFAVGDSASDLPMLALAGRGFAPGNADPVVRASGVTVLRRCYASGLAQAAAHHLGHKPGSCPVCRPPEVSRRTRAMLTVLDAQRSGRAGLGVAVLRGWLLRRRLAAPA